MGFFNIGPKGPGSVNTKSSTEDAETRADILNRSKGNAGAMRILVELLSKGGEVYKKVASNLGEGSQIWEKFKDECGENLDLLIQKYSK